MAQHRAQPAVGRDAEFVCCRADVGAVALVVCGSAVEAVLGYVERAQLEVRHAVVRRVVGLEVIVRERQAVVGAEAEGDARRYALAFRFDVIAGAAGVGFHDVDAGGHVLAEHVVDVRRAASIGVGATGQRHLVAVLQQRLFARLVDDAAGLTAPEQHGRRAAQHVHLFQVEGFAVVVGYVADAVQVQVTKGIEAAQHHVVADAAALAGVEGQPADVAQGFLQGIGVGFLDQLLRHDGHGLWHVLGQLISLAHAGGAALVALGRVVEAVVLYVHLRQGGFVGGQRAQRRQQHGCGQCAKRQKGSAGGRRRLFGAAECVIHGWAPREVLIVGMGSLATAGWLGLLVWRLVDGQGVGPPGLRWGARRHGAAAFG